MPHPFPGLKRPERMAYHSPQCSAEGEKRMELYFPAARDGSVGVPAMLRAENSGV